MITIVVKGSHIAKHYLLNALTTFRDLGIRRICTGEISATNSPSSCENLVTEIINLRTHMASDWIRVFDTAPGDAPGGLLLLEDILDMTCCINPRHTCHIAVS